ncbi:hypothetical protein DI09_67p150 [Mitosporidium daphniae]|uniref:U1 small nuclear ribonucleoprotein 70 kDa n=1 Tax=Mitosporidium daphniae TaxID=1485682 RepID=A0A098VN69_9MICR|nr:uncharacterized protein DI09_67p150 [Mitosporidium daphniae]KGG50527.1 hypothetical protein DI09_67p150 [Mitosporidium daphniae]|eukprot:XP_013236954.1 uncharacterized protein DI09_67p150 [Mitosporidium daphniae]
MGLYENEMKSTPRLRNPYYIPETPDTEAMESYFIFDNPYKSISKLSNTSSIKKKRRKLPEKHIFATLISCIKNPGRENSMDYSRGGLSSANTPKLSAFIQPPLNRFFIPRPFPAYKKPIDRAPDERVGCRHSGVGSFLKHIQDLYASSANSTSDHKDEAEKSLTRKQLQEEKLAEQVKEYSTCKPSFKSDPFKTIFVGRLPYSVTERQLRREFEVYGVIKSVVVVEKPGTAPTPRGYAFIEFEREKSAKIAYFEADGRKIDGQRRCVVDVERGRTVRGWLPRRLGGGLGGSRKGPAEICNKVSGRDPSLRGSDRKSSRSPPPRSLSPRQPSYRRPVYEGNERKRSRSPKTFHYSYPENPPLRQSSYRDYDKPSYPRRYEPLPHPASRRDYF